MTACAIYMGRQKDTCTRGNACICVEPKTLKQFRDAFDGVTIDICELAKEMVQVDDADLLKTGRQFLDAHNAMLECLKNNYMQCNLTLSV